MVANKPNVVFIPHGGGPLPLLGDARHRELVDVLQRLAGEIARPSAIIVISAHWEESAPTITFTANPPLIYDYYNFPDEAYRIEYPCPGEPDLARRIHQCLSAAGFAPVLDDQRGFDHGVFVPLKIMYPEANIPVVQVSMLSSLDPGEHIRLGAALGKLALSNVLVLGSGFSFHNMKAYFTPDTPESVNMNQSFERWLIETCSNELMDEQERQTQLINWQQAPHARYCHPREEHLLPLHVCYGVAQRACKEAVELRVLGKQTSLYRW